MERPIIESFSQEQITDLKTLFDSNPVSRGRSTADICDMLQHSDLSVGITDENDSVIGVGRVLSDFVYKAWIFDVRVRKDYHNQGIGKQIIQYIFEHPKFSRVKTFDLICMDETVAFYKNLGFNDVLENRNYLRFSR